MFKRRNPRRYRQIAGEIFYPRGGFRRAATYLWHRLRRLPDQPHRIGRGMAAGVFLSFTPLHGFQFITAALVSLLIRGNVMAAFVGTFAGNPLTTPFIALGSVWLGRRLLGLQAEMTPQFIYREFAEATASLWHNVQSVFGAGSADWHGLAEFYHEIFLPYALGGAILGGIAAILTHVMTVPLVRRYHRHRERQMAERIARLRMSQPPPSAPPSAPLPLSGSTSDKDGGAGSGGGAPQP